MFLVRKDMEKAPNPKDSFLGWGGQRPLQVSGQLEDASRGGLERRAAFSRSAAFWKSFSFSDSRLLSAFYFLETEASSTQPLVSRQLLFLIGQFVSNRICLRSLYIAAGP